MRNKKLGASAIILNATGQVLLVKHTYGRLNWELPGGNAEPNESITATVLREVWEETHLQVQVLHMTGLYYEADDDIHQFVFLCQPDDPHAMAHPDGNEISEVAFWPSTTLPRPISDFTIRRIHDAASGVQLPLPCNLAPRQWFT